MKNNCTRSIYKRHVTAMNHFEWCKTKNDITTNVRIEFNMI